MNPLLQAALGSVVRWALAAVAGFLVNAGVWKGEDAEKYVAAAAIAVVALGWGLWEKYKSRIKFLTALTLPQGYTENELREHIKSGAPTPTVTTPSNEIPQTSFLKKPDLPSKP